MLPLAEFKARSREIRFETDIPIELPPLRLDVQEMAEALDQLLDNAIKFNRPGGRVKFSVAVQPESVLLSVLDTGEGIKAETLERMWQVFEQDVDVGVNQSLGVEFLVAEQQAEENGHDDRRDHEMRKLDEPRLAELAVFDTALYESADRTQTSRGDVVPVESDKVGMTAALCQHELDDNGNPRTWQLSKECSQRTSHERLRSQSIAIDFL